MILDDNLEELTGNKNASIYAVNKVAWKKIIIKHEKSFNNGCFFLIIGGIISFFFVPNILFWLVGCFILGMVHKNIIAKRCKNLIYHGNLEYETGTDRVTRYSKSNYQIFYKEDIKQVTKHSFGLIIRKQNYASFDFLGLTTLNIENQDLLVLPSELAYYDKISKDILDMFAKT